MTDPEKQARIETLLRKSLLGEELVNTQFHLFSARSVPSKRVVTPRVVCANNVLLAKSSKYFLDLLSSDVNPSDPSLVDLTGEHDVPGNALVDEYGYGSDSDLEESNEPVPVTTPKAPRKRRATSKDDDESSDDESVSSDMFVMSPEQPHLEEQPVSAHKEGAGSVASSDTAVQNPGASDKTLRNQAAMRLRSLGSRHVLVKDTAFQTWYTLLNYLYTDTFQFLPLRSATPGGQPRASSTSAMDAPRCSAKSMYRLACKVGLDDLRDAAFSYIQSNLTEHNILKELSCSLVSTHPHLLEMELDVLYAHIGASPVVAEFSALARRVANKELAHGADIVIGIHARVLREARPLPFRALPRAVTVDRKLGGTSGGSEEKEKAVIEAGPTPVAPAVIRLAEPPGVGAAVPGPAPLLPKGDEKTFGKASLTAAYGIQSKTTSPSTVGLPGPEPFGLVIPPSMPSFSSIKLGNADGLSQRGRLK